MPQEKKIIALKYAAVTFGKMDEDVRDLVATKALLSISAITGWTVPASDTLMDILAVQFAKKMSESYANLNIEELEYAFRNKGMDVKDWGKSINLEMLDKVLLEYLDNRADLSMQEEKISTQLQIAETIKDLPTGQPMSDEEWQEWMNDISKYKLMLIPCDAYDYLIRTKKVELTAEQKHSYMERAINHLATTTDPATKIGIDFFAMKNKGIYSAEVTATLITISKRLVVFDHFHNTSK